MSKIKQKTKQTRTILKSPFKNYWDRNTIVLISIGMLLLITGFYFMGFTPFDNPVGLSYSPVILLIAYLIVFPLAILYKKK
jgi:hypothetical protein